MWLKVNIIGLCQSHKIPVCCWEKHTKENLAPETQLIQTKENLWVNRAHCQYGVWLQWQHSMTNQVCVCQVKRIFQTFINMELEKQHSKFLPIHWAVFPVLLPYIHEAFRGGCCPLSCYNSLSIFLNKVTWNIPEPVNEDRIVSHSSQVVSEQKMCVSSIGALGWHSRIQSPHRTASWLNVLTGRQIS